MDQRHTGYEKIPDNSINFQPREKQKWPFLLWLYMKTLGLYHSGAFVTVRRCNRCKQKGHEQFTTSVSFKQVHCSVCESFLWDHNGEIKFLTDEEIGARRLNHRGSFVFSIVWLVIIIGCTLTLIAVDFIRFTDHADNLVEMMSTICIQGLLSISALTAIVCNLNTTWPAFAPGQWASAVSPAFVVQRLRWVNMRETRTAGYLLFFGAVFFVTFQCTSIAQDLYAYGIHSTLYTPFDYFSIVVGIFNFTGISYLAYLLRRSFEKEVRLVCMFTEQNISDIDICRERLAATFDTFHVFREFTTAWMSLNVIFAVVSFLLEVHVWIISTSAMPYYRYERLAFLLACFLLPILAVGNVSPDYLWNRLLRSISRMRHAERELHWDKLMQFLMEQRPGTRPWQSVMAFVLSIIAVFAAIQFRILSSKAINSATNFNHVNVTQLYA